MKKNRTGSLIVVVLAMTSLSALAGVSDGSSIQLTDLPGDQIYSRIDGSIVVYTDASVGNEDIYYTDVTNPGVLVSVADGPARQTLPDISGDLIVYHQFQFLPPNMTGIFVYDINTDSRAQISLSTPGEPTAPSIDGNTVVYESRDNSSADIGVVDLSTGSSRLITNTLPEAEQFPVIGGHYVVYERAPFYNSSSSRQVVLYDLQTDTETALGPGQNPHTDGSTVVFASPTSGIPTGLDDFDVSVYDIATATTQIIVEPGNQERPRIDGDVLSYDSYWYANSTFFYQVIIYHLPSSERKAVSGGGLGLWNDVSGRRVAYIEDNAPNNFDVYYYEFTDNTETVEDILAFFDASVGDSTLEGVGNGNSATGRLGALRNMIAASGDLVNEGQIADACQQLLDAYNRVDGIEPPPDFAGGQSAPELAVRIQALRASLGCP